MKSLIPVLLSSLLLTACASYEPTQIGLNPTLGAVSLQTESDTQVLIETIDTREASFVLRITEGDKTPQLIGTTEPMRQQLDKLFRNGMIKAGYVVDPAARNSVQFQLNYLLADVTDTTFSFESKTRLVINVLAKNAQQQFTKSYNANGYLKGPLSPDFATLELDINQLIDKLTTEILNDDELHQFIQR
ncbi:YajG family lipoprotein [Shewanella sp. MF05960]|uniref:YajG family lipoprotein n=1 Tax=Shewanella sp. MF05960 TaxID=3434874 RepID=UPI003D797E8F